MSDENKNLDIQEVKEEKKCFCKSEEFKKFLIVTFGSFVGVFLALSLFAALHKPPMPIAPHYFGPRPVIEHQFRGDFDGPRAHKFHKHKGPKAHRMHREMGPNAPMPKDLRDVEAPKPVK